MFPAIQQRSHPRVANAPFIHHQQESGDPDRDDQAFDPTRNRPTHRSPLSPDHQRQVAQVQPIGRIGEVAHPGFFTLHPRAKRSDATNGHPPGVEALEEDRRGMEMTVGQQTRSESQIARRKLDTEGQQDEQTHGQAPAPVTTEFTHLVLRFVVEHSEGEKEQIVGEDMRHGNDAHRGVGSESTPFPTHEGLRHPSQGQPEQPFQWSQGQPTRRCRPTPTLGDPGVNRERQQHPAQEPQEPHDDEHRGVDERLEHSGQCRGLGFARLGTRGRIGDAQGGQPPDHLSAAGFNGGAVQLHGEQARDEFGGGPIGTRRLKGRFSQCIAHMDVHPI